MGLLGKPFCRLCIGKAHVVSFCLAIKMVCYLLLFMFVIVCGKRWKTSEHEMILKTHWWGRGVFVGRSLTSNSFKFTHM